MAKGYVSQIIGPVIDIRFAMEDLPNINDAVAIQFGDAVIYAEVMQQRGDGVVVLAAEPVAAAPGDDEAVTVSVTLPAPKPGTSPTGCK